MKEPQIIDNRQSTIENPDVIVLGAGAAGLFCALTAGKRGRSVTVLEHNGSVGEKIRISGGGRCNFTNLHVTAANFLSENPHFCKSALSRYTQHDFIQMVERHGIGFHEKKDGQLFCDDGAGQIIDMLLRECREAGVEIITGCGVKGVRRGTGFEVEIGKGQRAEGGGSVQLRAPVLVVATGGLSIPKLGATGFGYDIARQFGIPIVDPRPGLVPITIAHPQGMKDWSTLSGISLRATVATSDASFTDDLLLTHKGLSGPAVLQASSYWMDGKPLVIDLLPGSTLEDILEGRTGKPFRSAFEGVWPKRFTEAWLPGRLPEKIVGNVSKADLRDLESMVHRWTIQPDGTEGFQKAEVTVGGVDTTALSSKTMESRDVRGLFFIGEVVDVTGWLGGYNFQWAWSSGYAAGMSL